MQAAFESAKFILRIDDFQREKVQNRLKRVLGIPYPKPFFSFKIANSATL